MTTNMPTRGVNEHLELELAKHPERTYICTLLEARPQFSPERLIAEVQTETEYWMAMLANAKGGQAFLATFSGLEHVFDALKHEFSGLKDVQQAVLAHSKSDWGEANKHYCNSLMDFQFSLSDWRFAISEIGDDTPFDPNYPSKEECLKHNHAFAPRSSYQDMAQISPSLLRIYQNLDRVLSISQEVTQRQLSCLIAYMQEAEAQEAARRSRAEEAQKGAEAEKR